MLVLVPTTDLLQQVDGVPAVEHLGGEEGGGGRAPVVLNLLHELGHGHTLGHGSPRPGTGPELTQKTEETRRHPNPVPWSQL